MLAQIATSELLEEIDVTLLSILMATGSGEWEPSSRSFIPNLIESLEISDYPADSTHCSYQIAHPQMLWSTVSWFPSCHNTTFPSSATVERIGIITPGSLPIIERCQVLDATFSDTYRCPSLKELEVSSLIATRAEEKGKGRA